MTFDITAASVAFAREALLAGDAVVAVNTLKPVCAKHPDNFGAHYWLASALLGAGRKDEGEAVLDAARRGHGLAVAREWGADVEKARTDGDYAANIATQLYQGDRPALSAVLWDLAVAAGHRSLTGAVAQGLALQHTGRAEEAIAVFRDVVETWPSSRAHQFLLYPHFMVEDGPRRYAAEARAWAKIYAPELGEPVFDNPPLAGRRLRIGYVAPTLAGSQVRQFITPILESHDPAAVEVFLYPAKAETETGWPKHIAIRPIGDLADVEAAALIRDDRIDVLIDCWGHSVGGRLAMFAHRAAPVQAAWINFVQTTGLTRMDYVLHCDSAAAPGTAELFTEQVWHTGEVFIPYRPPEGRPPPHPTPALASGVVTFGSFNHPVKLSDATVAAWARILKGHPNGRLLLKYRYFIDPVLQRATQARFAAHGVVPERIVFAGHTTGPDYLNAFAAVDLALDPSPAPGGTTTCDALANGVPVLTLRGPDFYSRIGVCAALGVGLPELVAESWDDYVEKAVAMTADIAALNAMRAKVRPGFEAGPFRDEVGFTRGAEAAFREMFDRWQGRAKARGVA
ncbi:putative O-linked N-acetylglucosamine transferase (SPINDLY family) [Caulobacter ginsengisoli]|uniref:O-linked N-acetylglucosamine transferase (SPINDLY family) n=1 Tax=Caulobacter ginsengisoli TaxID=400775 RepID=A0ABU0IMP3_9CAUL|nr:tetratricopeptide repeat protein [Caulobacter ginsengisoli]MDQ0462675.1 putative O-linked N-acetylglucosamine transferase (SPINDLY family) [Caulobacter ginsengisoli]